MPSYRIISSDNHVFEPPDLWVDRVEPEYRDRAPHLVRDPSGDRFHCDGEDLVSLGGGTQPGRRFENPDGVTMEDVWENVLPGAYLPEAQVKDMDIDGIDVNVLYPTVGLLLYRMPDADFTAALFRAYNDWTADFCGAAPDRLKGIGMLLLEDIDSSIAEMERCAKLGLVGVMIPVAPADDRPYESPIYDPFWAAAQDLGIPLSLHVASHRDAPRRDDTKASLFCNADFYVRVALGDMIYSGVFERFPKLQVGSVEHELEWAAFFLDRLDYVYTQKARRASWHRFGEDMLPSDYFHRNVFLSFQEDARGIELRGLIGVDNLMWGSDYPHQEATFPRSQEILEEILADCTEEEKAKIAGANCARVFNLA